MNENLMKSSNIKKKNKMKRSDEEADRLSALPDPLLHHILSFMDMKEVIQTSFISRKWRYFWKYIPILNFDYSLWNNLSKKKENARPYVKKVHTIEECLNFVDGVLLLRDGSSTIQKIHFSNCYACDSRRLTPWLHFAIGRHVKELHIDLGRNRKDFNFPVNLFTSGIENVKLIGNYYTSVQLPGSICSAQTLRTLVLVFVKLPNGNTNGELVLNYPILESLILERCDLKDIKNLNVVAPQLKNLVVNNWKYDCEFNICSPNLLSLKLDARWLKKNFIGNFSSLVSATIDIVTLTMESECLIQVLKGLQTITTLQLNGSFEKLSEPMHLLEKLLSQFSNLRCLRLFRLRHSSCIQSLGNFLKSAPSIETLVLDIIWDDKLGTELTEWPVQDSFHHIRSVTIIYLKCCENFLKFPSFVLKSAVILENMTVCFFKKYKKNELAEFSKKLQSLPKASSSVKIYCRLC